MTTPLTRRDVIAHQSAVPWPRQIQVEQDLWLCRTMVALFDDGFLHEMLGTKMRALFQRRRGRDLFDLYWALTRAKPAVAPARIIESFQHYLQWEGSAAGRAEFIALLDAHLADRGFCSDMNPLLRVGITYDAQQAGDYVKTKLLSLLPAP